MIRKQVLLGLLICVVLGAAAHGGEKAVWKGADRDELQGPRHQIAVSVGMRTDETERVKAQPEIQVRFFRWLSRYSALTSEVGFTNRSDFAYRSEARTFSVGAGFRFCETKRVIAVFLEPGLCVHRHSGDLNGWDFTATRFGISLAMGASVKVFGGTYLDISLRQVVNAPEGRPIYDVVGPSPPPIGEDWDYVGGVDEYDLFNPTHLLISYRFGL